MLDLAPAAGEDEDTGARSDQTGTARRTDANGGGATRPDDQHDVLIAIGQRLRALRQERSLSLAQVASAAGLTRGFLSQLELGDTSASVSSLLKIAAALGVEVTSLFETPFAAGPPRRPRPTMLGGDGVVDYLLTPAAERRAQVIETHLEPGSYADTELFTRGGESARSATC